MPRRQEAAERRGLDRCDLAAQLVERPAAELAQDVRVAELRFGAARQEAAARQLAARHQPLDHGAGAGRRQREPLGRLCREEGPPLAGEAEQQRRQRLVVAAAQRGAVSRDVARRRQPSLSRHLDPFGAAGPLELRDPGAGIAVCALGDLALGQRAEPADEVLELVGVARPAVRHQRLPLAVDRRDDLRLEQLTQIGLPEELGEQPAVERQRLRPPLRHRVVPLVEERDGVGERQGAGEGGRRLGVDHVHLHGAALDRAQDVDQRRQVEDVAQDLAVGLEDDREAGVLLRRAEQLLGAEPLGVERHALAGAPPRQEQGARRVLAEVAGEQRRPRQLGGDRLLDAIGIRHEPLPLEWPLRGRQAEGDPVVVPQDLDRRAERRPELGLDGQRPRCVHPRPERGEDADPEVAELVAEALDGDGAVGRQRAGRLALFRHVAAEVVDRPAVEPVLASEVVARLVRAHLVEPPDQRADPAAERGGATGPVPLPERHPPRLAGRRADDDPVAPDLLDPPGRRAEQERVAGPRLVDHLLVELADPRALGAEVDGVQPAVRNRAAAGQRDDARPTPRRDAVGRPVPRQARRQVGHLVGGISPAQHVEHRVERGAGEIAVAVGAADQPEERADLPALDRGHRDDLLGEHVERLARRARLLDLAVEHGAADRGRLDQVAAPDRHDAPDADRPDRVTGTADPLEPARHRAGRLDLDDEVDRRHVDAELERAGGADAAEEPTRQEVLHLEPLAARDAAVVRARHLLARHLVQLVRDPLGLPPAVDEDDRAPVLHHQVVHLAEHRGHQARPFLWRQPGRVLAGCDGGPPHVGGRRDHRQIDPRHLAGVKDHDLAVPAQVARHLLERPLRGAQPDALRVAPAQRGQPLERQRQVRAALVRHQRVDLVHDHRVDLAQPLAGGRGQEEVERLGRGDEDLGRLAELLAPRRRTGVAGADADRGGPEVEPVARRHLGDLGERRGQVALDVVGQRLERRDVHHARAADRRLLSQPVDAGQEGGEGLAASGRGAEEGVLPGGDARPAELLHPGGCPVARGEPGLDRRAEVGGGPGHRLYNGGVVRALPPGGYASGTMDDQTRTEVEAAVFRRLVQHFRDKTEVQNIDVMKLAGFCRNCLAKWYRAAAAERGVELEDTAAREEIYGVPYSEWKAKHQK